MIYATQGPKSRADVRHPTTLVLYLHFFFLGYLSPRSPFFTAAKHNVNITQKKCIVIGRENRWKCRSSNTFRLFPQPASVFGVRHKRLIFVRCVLRAGYLPILCPIKKNPSAPINRLQTSKTLWSFGDLVR